MISFRQADLMRTLNHEDIIGKEVYYGSNNDKPHNYGVAIKIEDNSIITEVEGGKYHGAKFPLKEFDIVPISETAIKMVKK